MNTTAIISALALTPLAACAATDAVTTPPPPVKKPNIIFILVDDLGWGDLGALHQNARAAAGNPAFSTPNLDRLAAEGVRLTHHYCPAPVCAPSRASLLAGVHQGHANVRDNQFDKALEDNHTLASVLRQAGYATAAIGKWGLQGEGSADVCPGHPLNRGFDSFYGYLRHVEGHEHYPKENPIKSHHSTRGKIQVWDNRADVVSTLDNCYTADLFTARAKHWIIQQQQKPGQPFFLYLAYDTPHATIELPTQAYPAGGGLGGGLQWLGTPGKMINTASGTIDSWTHPDYRKKNWPDVYRRYATSVRRIDDAVGDLVQLLKDLKIDDQTMVVFASDNGPSCESYLKQPYHPDYFGSFGPFDGIKRDCWDGGIRVPALVRWPGQVSPNREIVRPSAFPDWMPTFASAAGLPAPARADGANLLPDLTGMGTPRPRKPVYVEYQQQGATPAYSAFSASHRNRRRNQMQAVRIGDFIGVRYDIKSAADNFEIYDVVTDPKEINNLATTPDGTTLQQTMKATVLQMRRPNPTAPRPYDQEPVPSMAAPAMLADGVLRQSFANLAPWVPDTDGLPVVRQAVVPAIKLPAAESGTAIQFTGFLRIPQDGTYRFCLVGCGRAFFRIHEAAVIDADKPGALAAKPSASITLKAGLHPFRLTYVAESAIPALALHWSGARIPDQPVPATAFTHLAPSQP